MEDVNKWKDVREPSDEEKRRIMGKVMKILTETLMGSHTYRFDGKVYRHEDGGPIGLEVTQVIARVVMLMWDKMAKKLFAELGMKIIMYERYVDDVNCTVIAKPEGTILEEGKLVNSEERMEEDSRMTRDQRTGRLIREIANTIMPMIKMVEDCPENHVSKRIPILDLEVWIDREEGEEGRGGRLEIRHRFFKKPMASEMTLNARLAYPTPGTRATLMEETLRRMRNNSPGRSWEEVGGFLTKWTLAMMRRGHCERFRKEIVERAVKRFEGEMKEHQEGRKDIYRSREERERQMAERGGRNRKDCWYREEDRKTGKMVTGVFKVKMMKGEGMKKVVERKIDKYEGPEGIKVKVVEEGGRTVKSFLVKGDPFPRKKCSRNECGMKEGECG
jgi:hypothetical protein